MAAALRRAVAQRFASSSPATFGLRRFMQERPAFRPAVPPDRIVPLADRVRDLGVGIASPRVYLDGLVPAKRDAAQALPAASITVGEARKVLRATPMEAARARVRAHGAGAVPYDDFMRLCCDAAGPSVARALDESGSVVVLGKTVFLRPDMVVTAIEKAIPEAHSPAKEEEELKAMEAQKADIDRDAAAQVRRELWCGLGYLVVQTAGFMRLTFHELSWDVMEPICFYVTSMYFIAGYAFFLRTKKEPSFEGFLKSRFATKQKRLMQVQGFDLRRYEELWRACGVPTALQARTPCASAMQESGHCHSCCH